MSNPKRFILLGDAGAGKSSFINLLHNQFYGTREADKIFCDYPQVKLAIPCANWLDCLDQKYKDNHSERDINDQTQSQTQICTSYAFRTENIHLQIIDTPGFNDTNGIDADEQNLAFIEKALKEVPFLSGIIMVVNGAIPRLGVSFKNFLHLLHQVWPNDLLNNCVAILTNCDELSVNLDPLVLHRDLNVDDSKTFHLQNSLFRWDRKNQSSKTIRRFRQDFEDNSETINKLVRRLLQFDDVSTQSFEVGAIKILIIEKCVSQSVRDMIDLLQSYKEQQVAQDGIEAARHTMQSNKEWDKHREINAIRWVEVPQCRTPSPPPQSKKKFTRQFFFSDQPKTSSLISPSKGRELHTSKSVDYSQEQRLPYSTSSDRSLPKAHSTFNDDGKRSQQPAYSASSSSHYDSGKHSSHQLASPQKVSTYASAYDSRSNNEQPTTASSSSKTGGSYSTNAAGGKYEKSNLSTLSGDSGQQRDLYSTSPSDNLRGSIDCRYSHTNSSHGSVYKQEQIKIQVTIPDNETRSHHDYARREEFTLQERTKDLKYKQQVLSASMMSLLQNLKLQVAQLRSINKNYDIIEPNRELLTVFKEVIKLMGDNSEMKRYFDETVAILEKK
jgi:GTPase SAR1 family protein